MLFSREIFPINSLAAQAIMLAFLPGNGTIRSYTEVYETKPSTSL
jgi:hypothetical protein